ncbi:MAG: acyl-CoA thioesterase [Muribaculaceae bacterium]|nr:acyl-CoA thioesterase [Bacteroides sp.]MDE5847783.1 acyl-CoA thioesterase [Muribaculaceae bacterium]MBD5420254.1 acyl-CoA thioesterase [Bacteroides sp.]MDE6058280.1 acyl-CoA thioesterase [Muribaculaceae bacterium]MDE6195153.1 acyl-CoA thioesterase [Muribaculaceae bacterium]
MSEKNDILEHLDAEKFRHAVALQLRFNDIDVLGHVNNNAQLALFDVGKTEFYNALRGQLADWSRVEAVIVNINCTFMEQIRFTDPMEVRTRVKKIGEKSFTLQQILRNTETGRICSMCESVMVSVDYATKASKPIPENIAEGLRKWL